MESTFKFFELSRKLKIEEVQDLLQQCEGSNYNLIVNSSANNQENCQSYASS